MKHRLRSHSEPTLCEDRPISRLTKKMETDSVSCVSRKRIVLSLGLACLLILLRVYDFSPIYLTKVCSLFPSITMALWVACMATSRGRVSVAAFTPAISAAARPFSRLPFVNSFARRQKSSILHSSTLSSSSVQLEKSLDVTHPAFDVVKKDVVEEYGAYCTLYRHKKSGAELMSVATDDDNKVCHTKSLLESEICLEISHVTIA